MALYSRSGANIVSPVVASGQAPSGSGSITDRNGNRMNTDGIHFYDTLSASAAAVTVTGASPSPTTFTYTNPAGGSSSLTMNYSLYTIETNFGCSGITDYGRSQQQQGYLVSSITLPGSNGSYAITYEATVNPIHAGAKTGRIASITLPTGGSITYQYTGTNNGINCADGSTAGLTRTVSPGGVWTYTRSQVSGSHWKTTLKTPDNNDTVIHFQKVYETERIAYQGLESGGNILATVDTCYNGAASPCTDTTVAMPITRRTILTTPNGLSSAKRDEYYNSYGMPTVIDEYNYGPTLVRKTVTSYASLGNIHDGVSKVVVCTAGGTDSECNSSGTVAAKTTYTYDGPGLQSTSGTPQHVGVSGSRGNPTTVSQWVAGSASLSSTFSYYDTGNIYQATGVNNQTTTYTYNSSNCPNSLLTGVTPPIASLATSMAWNCNGGVVTSTTDPNGSTTTNYNDANYWRPTSVVDPFPATTTFSYGTTYAESKLNFNGSTSTVDNRTTVDGLGRPHVSQRAQSQASSSYDSVETDYDSVGRVWRVSLPYSASAGGLYGGSTYASTTTYDALGRPLTVTDGGGGTTSYSYSKNDVYVSVNAPAGEYSKDRQLQYDALGRLTSVCEIVHSGSPLTGSGNCAQTTARNGYWTKYTYNVLNEVLSVTQNAQSGTVQTRTHAYDGLGRLTSESNPENGLVRYFWDTCPDYTWTTPGDLCEKKDNAGTIINYGYDSLHRLAGFAANTSTNCTGFVYDARPPPPGVTVQNTQGRLVETYTNNTCNGHSGLVTDEWFSYSPRGEITDVYQSTPNSGGYYHVSAGYWASGLPHTLSGIGLPTITYVPDGEGRVSTVSATSGQNPVTGTSYNSFSEPTGVTFGSADSHSFGYNPNTGRMTSYSSSVNGSAVQSGTLNWNPNGSLRSLAITDTFSSSDNQNCSYGYDDLARLASANCGSPLSQTFSFDAFGNLKKAGTLSFQPTYNLSTNRVSQLGSVTPTYDANGNLTGDGWQSYAFDWKGDATTVGSSSVTYDAQDRAVEIQNGANYTQIVYGPSGAKLALMNGQNLVKAFVPLPAGTSAVYNSDGLAYYRHSDWLGSSRLASRPSRTVYYAGAYAPYGENYAEAGTTDRNFTGQNQDVVGSGPYPLYDFLMREYHPAWGRWLSPDPAGLAAVDFANPQSLNRYAYALNNPTTLIDPSGLLSWPEPGWDPCGAKAGTMGYPAGPYSGANVNPCDPCSSASFGDAEAECGQLPGLRSDGTPILGGGSSVGISGMGGGGGIWSEAVPPFGGGGGFSLPCDFGRCVPGVDPANSFTPDVKLTSPGYGVPFRISIYVDEFLNLPLDRLVLQHAGRNAGPVASPLMPVVWYGGSAGLAILPGSAYDVQVLAANHPAETLWLLQLLNGYLTRGATPGAGALWGRWGRMWWIEFNKVVLGQ